MTDAVKFLPLKQIKVGTRTRTNMGDMEGLIASIKDKGILQPITVDAKFNLLAGGRRYAAATAAGLKQIPCLIRDTTEERELDSLEVELIENSFREDFTWDEKCLHVKKLHDLCSAKNVDWSGRKLAALLDRGVKTVQRQLVLADAMQKIPELSKAKTQDEAEKTLKKMSEHVAVQELRRRQDDGVDNKDIERVITKAKANYRIGDCFAGMAESPTNGMVHFIELDPPYAIALGDTKKGDDTKKKSYNEVPVKKYEEFMTRMASETYRVANHHAWMICWFGPTHFTLVKTALVKAGWNVNDIPGVWIKPTGQTMQPEYNLANCYEPFFICRKGQPTLVKRGRSNVFQFSPEPAQQKYHPTQRPTALISEILETFAMPRQICLVPCLGSGATLRAAYLHGMLAYGWDLSEEYKDKFLLGVQADMEALDSQE